MDYSSVMVCAWMVLMAVTMVQCSPETILDFKSDDHQHKQELSEGNAVTGSYSWMSPEGYEFVVQYIADDKGYRIIESNAVPLNADGVFADGQQGSFASYEEGSYEQS